MTVFKKLFVKGHWLMEWLGARVSFLLDTNSQSPGTRRGRGSRKSGSPTAELEVAAAAKTNSSAVTAPHDFINCLLWLFVLIGWQWRIQVLGYHASMCAFTRYKG